MIHYTKFDIRSRKGKINVHVFTGLYNKKRERTELFLKKKKTNSWISKILGEDGSGGLFEQDQKEYHGV